MNLIVNNVAVLFAVSMLSFSQFSGITLALKLSKLIVPQYVFWNKQTELECRYILEKNEKLYRVQWYKDNDEFYRYDQKSYPPQVSYEIDKINVDKSQSNENRVVLRNVNLMMSGVYKCEVSAEARSFSSEEREARMEVIAMPNEGPRIHGEEDIYQIGDAINLTCTSGKSYPPAKLRWFINKQEVPSECEHFTDRNGLMSSKTRLSLIAGPDHFVKGEIEIKCQATITVGNHSLGLTMLPVQHNNPALFSSKYGYQTYALFSARGNTMRVAANVFLSLLAPIWLVFLFNGITVGKGLLRMQGDTLDSTSGDGGVGGRKTAGALLNSPPSNRRQEEEDGGQGIDSAPDKTRLVDSFGCVFSSHKFGERGFNSERDLDHKKQAAKAA